MYVEDPLDIVIPPDSPVLENPVLRPIIDKYAVLEPGQRRVIGWDAAKYVNHCCHANIISTGYGFEIALRDIQPGEEMRDEYGIFNLGWTMELNCQFADVCRGFLRADDFETYRDGWDAEIQVALKQVMDVEQPLWALLDAETAVALRHFLDTGEGYQSVEELHYERPEA
ncbi:MAG: SET domain-containing protein [Anaerolineae bacterium]|nr:SET domain-containing protein [Anaerolineae bacterium]